MAIIKKCDCGDREICPRVVHSNYDGKLWIEAMDHFRCGKVKAQVNRAMKIRGTN